jgi:hypothetical protein
VLERLFVEQRLRVARTQDRERATAEVNAFLDEVEFYVARRSSVPAVWRASGS